MKAPDLILHNGTIATLDAAHPQVSAVAVAQGRIVAVGGEELLATADDRTKRIDLKGRRVTPGLNDSHLHVIRGGLFYNLELRWDGVPSLADALAMLKEQARRTPPPHWVRVIGGWSEFQFAEQRMPTLEEINAAAPDTPVFVLHLYARALLNGAALRALGYDKDTPNPPGGLIERDKSGNPTGLLIAEPNALILYASIARGPKLGFEDQLNSSRQFMRELNRLGITSAIDAGGGGQNYPEDYRVIEELHKNDQMTVRIAYNLFAQKPGEELADYRRWTELTGYGAGSEVLRMNGGGENLVWSAADFENFLQVRHLRRVDLPLPRHLRGGEPGNPLQRNALVHRSRRDDQRRQHRAGQGPRRRHRHSTPDGLSGRILHPPLRHPRRGGDSAHLPHAGGGRAGRRRDRRHPGGQLQSVGFIVLAGLGEDRRRHPHVPGEQPPDPAGGAAAVDRRERLVLGRGE
jgi:hypothetical protein